MNYRKPRLQEKLAAEYVLGTLRGQARRRFERLLNSDANLRLYVKEWETRLIPLAAVIGPVEPPARVWQAIEAKLTPKSAPVGRAGLGAPFWRALAFFSSALAFSLAVYLGVAPKPTAGPGASYIVVLKGDSTKPVMLVRAEPKGGVMHVRVLNPTTLTAQQSLELWALPQRGKPRSLGLLAADGVIKLKLTRSVEAVLADVAAMAVSLEPKGGSPTGQPTGPVLYSGELIRDI